MRRLSSVLFLALMIGTPPAVARAESLTRNSDASDVAPGHWVEIPNSQLASVVYKGPLAEVLFVGNGPTSITGNWSGAAWDSDRERLVVWGGGHNDYAGNEIYAFDIQQRKWARLTEPSSIAGYDGKGIYPDGTPASRHTYNGLQYIPDRHALFSCGGSIFENGGGDGGQTWLYDFTERKWIKTGAINTDSSYGSISAYDPVTHRVWFAGGASDGVLKEYDPAANRWIKHTYYSREPISIYTTGALDPIDRLFVAVGGKSVYAWHMNSDGNIAYSLPQTTGDTAPQNTGYPGFVWDPVAKLFVAWMGGTDIYTLDPKTWRWTRHAAAADNAVTPTPRVETGTYGRFQYIPSRDIFILVNGIRDDVFLYAPGYRAKRAGAATPAPAGQ